MPLNLHVDKGGEYLLPFAKNKLKRMKAEMSRTRLPLRSRWIQASSGEWIWISSLALSHGQSLDRIRITAPGFPWQFSFSAPNLGGATHTAAQIAADPALLAAFVASLGVTVELLEALAALLSITLVELLESLGAGEVPSQFRLGRFDGDLGVLGEHQGKVANGTDEAELGATNTVASYEKSFGAPAINGTTKRLTSNGQLKKWPLASNTQLEANARELGGISVSALTEGRLATHNQSVALPSTAGTTNFQGNHSGISLLYPPSAGTGLLATEDDFVYYEYKLADDIRSLSFYSLNAGGLLRTIAVDASVRVFAQPLACMYDVFTASQEITASSNTLFIYSAYSGEVARFPLFGNNVGARAAEQIGFICTKDSCYVFINNQQGAHSIPGVPFPDTISVYRCRVAIDEAGNRSYSTTVSESRPWGALPDEEGSLGNIIFEAAGAPLAATITTHTADKAFAFFFPAATGNEQRLHVIDGDANLTRIADVDGNRHNLGTKTSDLLDAGYSDAWYILLRDGENSGRRDVVFIGTAGQGIRHANVAGDGAEYTSAYKLGHTKTASYVLIRKDGAPNLYWLLGSDGSKLSLNALFAPGAEITVSTTAFPSDNGIHLLVFDPTSGEKPAQFYQVNQAGALHEFESVRGVSVSAAQVPPDSSVAKFQRYAAWSQD
jgi:hypothetical protein